MSPRRDQQAPVRDPLPALQRDLEDEFGKLVPIDTIDREAQHALGEFQGARIREFVPVFAWRHARARLRETI